MEYLPRIADASLQERLEAFGAILIEGPKWTGKTTTAMQHAKSIIKMQDPDKADEYLETAATMPSLLLKGEKPRLIDEWQDAPKIWDAVRLAVDNSGGFPGQYILTGSNTVDKTNIRHTGTGRITRMKMYPMSLWESKDSSGNVSVRELFYNPSYDIDGATSKLDIPELIRVACRGGWPVTLQMKEKACMMIAKDYVNSVCNNDISAVDGRQRNPKIAKQLLKSYARNISTVTKKASILADITASGDISLTMNTFDDYVEALEKLFVIQDIDAWCPAIRSKTAIRSAPKRSFTDPSIAVAALGQSAESLELQLKTFGFIFEQMCIRDLRVYADALEGTVYHYRDKSGLECDSVIHLRDGRYGLIEIKLGGDDNIEHGAKTLKKLKDTIDTDRMKEPSFMMVLVGKGKYAYRRDDGVYVVPITCLKD